MNRVGRRHGGDGVLVAAMVAMRKYAGSMPPAYGLLWGGGIYTGEIYVALGVIRATYTSPLCKLAICMKCQGRGTPRPQYPAPRPVWDTGDVPRVAGHDDIAPTNCSMLQ